MEIPPIKPGKPHLPVMPQISFPHGSPPHAQASALAWPIEAQLSFIDTANVPPGVLDELLETLRLIGESARDSFLALFETRSKSSLRIEERLNVSGTPPTSQPLAPAPALTFESLKEELSKIDQGLFSTTGPAQRSPSESLALREMPGAWMSPSQGEPATRPLLSAGQDPQRSTSLRQPSEHAPRPIYEERGKPGAERRPASRFREALRRAASWCQSRFARLFGRQNR